MNKRITAVLLTVSTLACLCACGVEKPELEPVSVQTNSTEVTSAATTEKKKSTVRNSHIKHDFSKSFHVDADVKDCNKTSLPVYDLKRIDLTEDQFAKSLMSGSGYSRKKTTEGVTVYIGSNEKLVVDLDGRYSNPVLPSPNLTYALDKGKEYETAVKDIKPGKPLDNEDAVNAAAQVKEILDKLPVKYDDDLLVGKIEYDELNENYSSCLGNDDPDSSDEDNDQSNLVDPDLSLIDNVLLSCEGQNAQLDKDFRFTPNDGCFVVKGKLKIDNRQISGSLFDPYSITAAVSSRGIEYMHIDNLYSTDNGSSDSPVIPAEQAVEAVYNEYVDSMNGDIFEVYINKIDLNYLKDFEASENLESEVYKASLRPVWRVSMEITNDKNGYRDVREAEVYADSGELVTECDLISYLDIRQE